MVMLDCFGGKWKGHNGFKLGYFTVVEKELRKLLPGTTHRVIFFKKTIYFFSYPNNTSIFLSHFSHFNLKVKKSSFFKRA